MFILRLCVTAKDGGYFVLGEPMTGLCHKKIENIKGYIKKHPVGVFSWGGALFLLCFGLTIRRYFGVTLVEQALFHLSAPLQGVDGRLVSGFIRHAALQPALLFFMSLVFFSSFPSLGSRIRILGLALWPMAVFCVYSCFSGYVYLVGYLFPDQRHDDFYRKHVEQPEVASIAFGERRNLVVLYLESLEASFGDRKFFSVNLLPELSAWRERHASVKDAYQAYGTGWTIAGIVSSWSGLPLRSGAGASKGQFMPGVVMVPDILARNGYALRFVQGTSLSFTGKKYLFLSHGFTQDQYIGLETVLKKHPDWIKKYYGPSEWGLRDSVTYDLAKKSLRELSQIKKPFALFMLTVNPHFSKGFVEPGWRGPRVEGFDDDEQAYADVVTNADSLAADFLHWISQQDFADKTTVIVLSDHLVMGTALTPFLKKHSDRRHNLNIVINPVRPLKTDGRAISQFDWAPTMLEAVGARLPEGRLGLGVSLFSGNKTLVERLGVKTLNHELTRYSQYYIDAFINGNKKNLRPRVTQTEKMSLEEKNVVRAM